MYRRVLPITIAGLALVGGCATLPPYQGAPTGPNSSYQLGEASAFDKLDYEHRFLDAHHTVLYMQNQGGGGGAAGALFGPLGVLANVGMIKARTEADAKVLYGKVPLDVYGAFKHALGSVSGLSLSAGPSGQRLSPYLYLENIDGKRVRIAAMLVVDDSHQGRPWVRTYVYETTDVLTEEQIAAGLTHDQLEPLIEHVEAGFDWTLSTLVRDADGKFAPREAGVIHSDFITPRIQVAVSGYSFDAGPGRIGFATKSSWPRMGFTVYSLPRDAATVENGHFI